MQAYSRPLMAMLVAGVSGSLHAGEPAGNNSQRELLQPPKTQIASPITDRFAIRGLFFSSSVATDVRYDSSAGVPGTLIDGENTLGLPGKLRKPSLDMMFRMGTRHRIHADIVKLTRHGDEVISQQIRFGNDIYQPGDRLVSTMDLRKMGIGWTWSALRTERLELGAGLALHLMQVEGDLRVPARFERELLDAAGPFPSLTFAGTWRMTRRFSLNLSGDWLSGSIDAVEGHYHSVHADLQFRIRPNLSVGAGYSQTLFSVNSATTDFAGHFRMKYAGPEAFLRVSF